MTLSPSHPSLRLCSYILFALVLFMLSFHVYAAAPRFRTAVTTDGRSHQEPSVVKRANGDLVVVMNGTEPKPGLYVSISKNDGRLWSNPQYVIDSWDDSAIMESEDGELVLFYKGKTGLSIMGSFDGFSWDEITDLEFTAPNDSIGNILQSSDGTYFITFSKTRVSQGDSDVYVASSQDLTNWEIPVLLSQGKGSHFDASMVETYEGTFLLAYNSYPKKCIMVLESADGNRWGHPHCAVNFTSNLAHRSVNLVQSRKRTYLLYSNENVDVYASIHASNSWSRPFKLYPKGPFGAEGVILRPGIMGLVYTDDVAGARDIYFDSLRVRR